MIREMVEWMETDNSWTGGWIYKLGYMLHSLCNLIALF